MSCYDGLMSFFSFLVMMILANPCRLSVDMLGATYYEFHGAVAVDFPADVNGASPLCGYGKKAAFMWLKLPHRRWESRTFDHFSDGREDHRRRHRPYSRFPSDLKRDRESQTKDSTYAIGGEYVDCRIINYM